MALTLTQIKELHDKAYNFSDLTREKSANDLVFYWITHWDDAMLADSQLAYRGEFDILRKAGRDIMADLAAMPSQIDFFPKNETSEEDGEFADAHYRAGTNSNSSKEAFDFADQDAVVCGVGNWQLKTRYCSDKTPGRDQEIYREFIPEGNNTVFWDPNDLTIDKRNAVYVSRLKSFSEDGYKELVHEMTGEDIEKINPSDFKSPERSYSFPWIGGESSTVYVVEFYHREKVKDKVLTMEDPFGTSLEVVESQLNEVMDELLDAGYEITAEKDIKRWEVTLYIASGKEILNGDVDSETGERGGEVIVGEHLPIVPQYGEYAIVEGQVHWEGITRLAKDPQRLRDFQLSYLADIVSRSPRQKPIFWPEQIAGFEDMYQIQGADNNYPYLLQHRKTGDGVDLPIGPVAVMPEQKVPDSLIQSIALSREAVSDVANPGVPQDVADTDISGKAVQALQAKIDKQGYVYQDHRKYARRRDAEIWVSMAKEILDTPRKVLIELPDGTKQEVQVMDTVIDADTGEIVTINDISSAEFELSSRVSADYETQKQQTLDKMSMMVSQLDPNDPIRKALQLKQLVLIDGVDFDDIKEYANKQLVLQGFKEPQTDEEREMLEAAQTGAQEPDAATLLAIAENKKGDADLLEQQRKGIEMQLKAQNEQAKTQIDGFKAQTDRMDTQIDAQEANAKINSTNIDSFGKKIDNTVKMIKLKDIEQMTDEQIFQRISEG